MVHTFFNSSNNAAAACLTVIGVAYRYRVGSSICLHMRMRFIRQQRLEEASEHRGVGS